MRIPLLIALVTVLTLAAPAAAEDAVIVNGASAVAGLTEDDLKDYYLGKKASWPDGSKVVVVVLKDGPSHDKLMSRLGKSGSQFTTGWKKLVFTGKGTMPEQVGSEDELIAFVAKTPGAIGYADAGKVKEGVKAVPGRGGCRHRPMEHRAAAIPPGTVWRRFHQLRGEGPVVPRARFLR
jgi:ABC-type phosphate transport system substrate-binding protein